MVVMTIALFLMLQRWGRRLVVGKIRY